MTCRASKTQFIITYQQSYNDRPIADIEQVMQWAASKKLSDEYTLLNALSLFIRVSGRFGDAYTRGHLKGKNPCEPNETVTNTFCTEDAPSSLT